MRSRIAVAFDTLMSLFLSRLCSNLQLVSAKDENDIEVYVGARL